MGIILDFFKRCFRRQVRKAANQAAEQTVKPVVTKAANDLVDQASQTMECKEVLEQWQQLLPQFPVWALGGENQEIETIDGVHYFSATFEDENLAQSAVDQYRQVLLHNGFTKGANGTDGGNLFKTVGGIRCQVDLEHCFDGDKNVPMVGFLVQ